MYVGSAKKEPCHGPTCLICKPVQSEPPRRHRPTQVQVHILADLEFSTGQIARPTPYNSAVILIEESLAIALPSDGDDNLDQGRAGGKGSSLQAGARVLQSRSPFRFLPVRATDLLSTEPQASTVFQT